MIDSNSEALKEYRRQMYPDPNPSAGLASQFLMYLLTNQYNPERVYRVSIGKDDAGKYVAFPIDDDLAGFDLSDRKWVVISIGFKEGTQEDAPIVNATDSDWLHYEKAFNRLGIQIEFLCKAILKSKGNQDSDE